MKATNDITGDKLISKPANDAFRDGWDRIFGVHNKPESINNEQDELVNIPHFLKPQAS